LIRYDLWREDWMSESAGDRSFTYLSICASNPVITSNRSDD
jgi:hypothetical protein